MPINMRLSQEDKRKYSPDRDIAYCGVHLVNSAMLGLDPGKRSPWIETLIANTKLDEDELGKAAQALATYFNSAALDPEQKAPMDALKAAGFLDADETAQHVICAKIGQVFLATTFGCIRDVTDFPDQPVYDSKEIKTTAERVAKTLRAYKQANWLTKTVASAINYVAGISNQLWKRVKRVPQ